MILLFWTAGQLHKNIHQTLYLSKKTKKMNFVVTHSFLYSIAKIDLCMYSVVCIYQLCSLFLSFPPSYSSKFIINPILTSKKISLPYKKLLSLFELNFVCTFKKNIFLLIPLHIFKPKINFKSKSKDSPHYTKILLSSLS